MNQRTSMHSAYRRVIGIPLVLVALSITSLSCSATSKRPSSVAFPSASSPPSPTAPRQAATSNACNRSMSDPTAQVKVDGEPRSLAVTRDGCWIFTTAIRSAGAGDGIAVFRRTGGSVTLARFQPVRGSLGALAMTRDGTLLIVRADRQLIFFDIAKLITGSESTALGVLEDQHFFSNGEMVITADDKYLFAGQGRNYWVSVVDLDRVRSRGFGPAAIIGGIPTAAIIAGESTLKPPAFFLALSPDARLLYAVGHAQPGSPAWVPNPPRGCELEDNNNLLVIDVQRATSNPGPSSVIAVANIECEADTPGVPQLATSPEGNIVYMTLPRENALVVLDTQPARLGLAPKIIGRVPLGPVPKTGDRTLPAGAVPRDVVTINGGKRIVVANSNGTPSVRPEDKPHLTVIDATRIEAGASAVLGTVPTGLGQGSMEVTSDGRTLLVLNPQAHTIQIIDLQRLALEPVRSDVK
jgi:hypothetical protein